MEHDFALVNYRFIHTKQFKENWEHTNDETRKLLQAEIDRTIEELSEEEKRIIDSEF